MAMARVATLSFAIALQKPINVFMGAVHVLYSARRKTMKILCKGKS